jgi:predicted O-methyltransferase YrrM
LVHLYKELGYKEGAEVGTAEGRFAKAVCEANPGVKLHCIDPWEKYEGYNDFRETYYEPAEEKARKQLAPFDVNIIKKYSLDGAKDFEDKSLDFVYIDANHDVRHVIEDIDTWMPKVRPGGMISGHDWSESNRMWRYLQVLPAVHAYVWSWKIKPYFILGRDDRIEGEYRERYRSWFWIV